MWSHYLLSGIVALASVQSADAVPAHAVSTAERTDLAAAPAHAEPGIARSTAGLGVAAFPGPLLPDALAADAPLLAASDCDPSENPFCDEIRRLAAHAAVREAFAFIERTDDRGMQDLVTLTEIPAPPFMEDERGVAYAEMLREAGADSVWTDEEGNVIALRRGTNADENAGTADSGNTTLVLSGHLDTVFPEGTDVTVRMRGDTLFAPGIGDDTRGLIVVLTVLRAMEAADLETESDILFVGTVGEEGLGDLRGMKYLFRDGGPRIDAFISVDGGSDARIVHQALGSRRYRITYQGPGGHSWGAFGTVNPAHALGRAIRIFDEAADEYTSTGTRTSYNVGRIGGGTSVNSIPFEAWMEVDMRSESQERLMEIDELFREVVQQALDEQNAMRRRGPELSVDVDLVGDRPSGETPTTDPLVQRAMAIVQHYDEEPQLARSSTDSNIPISIGVPAITISRGGQGANAHAPEEWWRNVDGHEAIQRALVLVLAQAGFADATE